MIVERVIEAKKKKIKQYPCHTNRASEMGHPCARYLYYNRTAWQEKALPDVGLQFVFDIGNVMEELVLQDLREAGFTVLEQQRMFEWKEHQITGHIDGKILIDGTAYPVEIKSVSPFVFNAINSIEDMKKSKYLYMRKYPAQMTLYLLMDEKERGVMLFKNKSTGALKEIWVNLDYELGEALLKKAELVNECVRKGEPPEGIEYDEAVCGECAFKHICLPEVVGKEFEVAEDKELAELLNRWWELKKYVKEYEELDKELKQKLEGKKIAVGDFLINGKWMTRKVYNVPAEVKAQYAEERQYWKREIIRL